MMTYAPLANPEDLKVLIKEGLIKICTLALDPKEYEALKVRPVPDDTGTHGDYLAVGLSMLSNKHIYIKDIMLYQPDSSQESPHLTLPWYEPRRHLRTSYNPQGTPDPRRGCHMPQGEV